MLCNRYGLPIAVRSLGEVQEASEALVSVAILAERDFLGNSPKELRPGGVGKPYRLDNTSGSKNFGQPQVTGAGLTTPETDGLQTEVNIDLLLGGWIRASALRCPWIPLNHATSARLH